MIKNFLDEFYSTAPILLITIISVVVSFTSVLHVSTRIQKKEMHEINNDVELVYKNMEKSVDVIDLMKNNVAELREYYVISKQQARKSFTAALLICILGFILFALGILTSYFGNENVVTFTTISGSIVELISGLFFFMYKNSLNQLNIYHERLGTTEKYLIAMQLIDKMSEEKKDSNYRFLMEVILIDNSSIVRNKADISSE